MAAVPFTVSVADTALVDLGLRLQLTRWPDDTGEGHLGTTVCRARFYSMSWNTGADPLRLAGGRAPAQTAYRNSPSTSRGVSSITCT